MKQILLNFCSNAVKFSKKGEVRLDVHFDGDRQRLRFEVSDSGIGMSEAELSRLFKPFAQADVSTTRRFGGTGLGLYICKQLAELLGGTIHVESEVGRGSCFSLTLPLGVDVAPPGHLLTGNADFDDFERPAFQNTSIEVPNLSGRVLVAEDGADNQRLLGSLLRQAGVEFDMVGDGSLAVEQALRHEYALVFMDIRMPVMDGVAATRLLRSKNYRGPIVALTANVMAADVALYRQSGCTDVLAKPIDRQHFYRMLLTHVGSAQVHEERIEPIALDPYDAELAEITGEFVRGLPATFESMDRAARTGDLKTLGSLLHTLKGTAGSYGFAELTRIAEEGEARLGTGAPAELLAVCGKLRVALAERAASMRP